MILESSNQYQVSTTGEVLLEEYAIDLTSVPGANITLTLTALLKSTGGATGTFKLRMGGTIGAVDGTVVDTITTTSATLEEKTAAATVTNPAAATLFKITGLVSSGAQTANIKGATILLPEAGGAADATPPVVSNFTPATGLLVAPNDPIGFDVTDGVGLRRVFVLLVVGGETEAVHDGTSFLNGYSGSRTGITGGYRYSVYRAGGYPAGSMTVKVFALDTSGNEP